MTPNPYYTPAAFDLTVIGEVSWSDEPYQFDITVLWQGHGPQFGKFYVASDSGCSCPCPFENITDISDLTLLPQTFGLEELGRILHDHMLKSPADRDAAEVSRQSGQILNLIELARKAGLR